MTILPRRPDKLQQLVSVMERYSVDGHMAEQAPKISYHATPLLWMGIPQINLENGLVPHVSVSLPDTTIMSHQIPSSTSLFNLTTTN
jgi:hypothetical protein